MNNNFKEFDAGEFDTGFVYTQIRTLDEMLDGCKLHFEVMRLFPLLLLLLLLLFFLVFYLTECHSGEQQLFNFRSSQLPRHDWFRFVFCLTQSTDFSSDRFLRRACKGISIDFTNNHHHHHHHLDERSLTLLHFSLYHRVKTSCTFLFYSSESKLCFSASCSCMQLKEHAQHKLLQSHL